MLHVICHAYHMLAIRHPGQPESGVCLNNLEVLEDVLLLVLVLVTGEYMERERDILRRDETKTVHSESEYSRQPKNHDTKAYAKKNEGRRRERRRREPRAPRAFLLSADAFYLLTVIALALASAASAS